MFWRENPCFGAKTKTILGSINKNGFLNHPTHNQKQTQPNLAHPHVSLGSNRNTPVVKIEQNY